MTKKLALLFLAILVIFNTNIIVFGNDENNIYNVQQEMLVNDVANAPQIFANIPYTRDVFASPGENFLGVEKLLLGAGGDKVVALNEMVLQSLSNFSKADNTLTFNSIKYKFGPLGSAGNPNNALNAARAKDKNPITIPLGGKLLSSIGFIATAANESGSSEPSVATIKIKYLGDSTLYVISDITKISSYRDTTTPVYQAAEKLVAPIQGIRPDPGTYLGRIYEYTIRPVEGKFVESIIIECPQAVVLAATGIGFKYSDRLNLVKTAISSLPQANEVNNEYRGVVAALSNELAQLKSEGLTDSEVALFPGIDNLYSLDERLLRVLNITNTIDAYKVRAGITFSGKVAKNTINKENVKVNFGDMEILPTEYSLVVNDNTVEVIINNTLDYSKEYSIIIKKTVKSGVDDNFNLYTDFICKFTPTEPFSIISYSIYKDGNLITNISDAAGTQVVVKTVIVNNMLVAKDAVVTTGLFSPNNLLVDSATKKVTLNNLIPEIVTFTTTLPTNVNGYKLECFIWDEDLNSIVIKK